MSFPFTDQEPDEQDLQRLALLQAMLTAIDNRGLLLDIAYRSADAAAAADELCAALGFDSLQATLVLEMPFGRLTMAARRELARELAALLR